MKNRLLIIAFLSASLAPMVLRAEEYGSGHYMPGAMASFADVPPTNNALIYLNMFTFYGGDATASQTFQLGGSLALNVEASVYADTSVILYQTPWTILGGRYGMGLAIPYVWMDVKGNVQKDNRSIRSEDRANGIGDIEALPLVLEWKSGDVSYGACLGVYMPTGEFDRKDLANIGKNYWTFEPCAHVSWLSSKIGTEASLFSGFDVSTKNEDTDYQSGNVFHLDGTLAQHFPLLGGFAGAGVTGFYYKQVTADSGSGAKLGDFEGRTMGVGPVVSHVMKIGKTDVMAEAKWLREFDAEKRLEGDLIWVKVAVAF